MAAFLDTNILLYAFSTLNEGEIEKVALAGHLIDRLIMDRRLIVSAKF